jgi:hypothetical protein
MSTRKVVASLFLATAVCAKTSDAAPLPFQPDAWGDSNGSDAGGCAFDASSAVATAPPNSQVDDNALAHVIWWGWRTLGADAGCYGEAESVFGPGSSNYNEGIGGTRWMNTMTQYTGVSFWTGDQTSAYSGPGMPIDYWASETIDGGPDAAQITYYGANLAPAEVFAQYIASHEPTTPDDIYVVMMPPGSSLPHEAGQNNALGPYNFAFVGWPNGCPGGLGGSPNPSQMQATIQHEIAERSTSQWQVGSCQIGDPCSEIVFDVQAEPWFNDPYSGNGNYSGSLATLQALWSNEAHDCVYGRTEDGYGFGIGQGDGQLWMQSYSCNTPPTFGIGGWNISWGNDGYSFVGKPSVVSWAPYRLDAFALDTDNRMCHGWSDNSGASHNWEAFPTTFTFGGTQYQFNYTKNRDEPDATSTGSYDLQMFAFMEPSSGSGNPLLVLNSYDDDGAWSGWTEVPYYFSGYNNVPASKISVDAFRASSGAVSGVPIPGNPGEWNQRFIILSYIDINNNIWIGTFNEMGTFLDGGAVLSGASLGGLSDGGGVQLNGPALYWQVYSLTSYGDSVVAEDLDVSTSSPGQYDIVLRDTNGNFWDVYSTNGGQSRPALGNWEHPSGHPFAQTPGVIGMGDGRLLVIGVDGNANSWAAFMDNGNWTGWVATNGYFRGGIDVTSF